MNSPEFSLFYITCPDQQVAEKIGEALLNQKLIACTNILPGMTSQYWWQGKLEKSQEVVLILKAFSSRKAAIEAQVKALHPYEVPSFLQLPILDGSKDYFDWMRSI